MDGKMPWFQKFWKSNFWDKDYNLRGSIENPNNPINIEYISGGGQSRSGLTVNHDNSLAIAAFWNGVQLISETLASFPFHIKRTTEKGSEIVRDHPLEMLLKHEPNSMMSSFDFREQMQVGTLTYGNGIAWIKRNRRGGIDQLIPCNIAGCPPVKVTERFKTFYDIELITGQKKDKVPGRDIFHVKGMGYSGLWGKDVVNHFKDTLGLAMGQEYFNSEFYKNGASLNGVLEVVGNANDQQRQQLGQSFNQVNAGSGGHHQTPVLPPNVKYHQIGINPEAAQFLQSRMFSVEEIARILNIQVHKLKNLDRATNNNIEQQAQEFIGETVRPWVIKWEQEANMKLLTEEEKRQGYFTSMNMNALLRGDMASRAAFYNIMLTLGVFSRNEVRRLEEMNTKEGLDDNLTPMNLTTNPKGGEVQTKLYENGHATN